MKHITIKKMARVENPDKDSDIVAYQVVALTLHYFENPVVCEHDTRIMQDGSQFVIGGDGFIPHDYKVV